MKYLLKISLNKMGKINFQVLIQACHAMVSCVKESIPAEIIFRIQPFFLQFSPKGFSDVQVRGIGRKKGN
jgi:hypothetical protein